MLLVDNRHGPPRSHLKLVLQFFFFFLHYVYVYIYTHIYIFIYLYNPKSSVCRWYVCVCVFFISFSQKVLDPLCPFLSHLTPPFSRLVSHLLDRVSQNLSTPPRTSLFLTFLEIILTLILEARTIYHPSW